jgi:hypothetical protein
MYKMIEDIARETEHLTGQANIRAINKLFLGQDESHLWPISGKFNATRRAIRTARKIRAEFHEPIEGLEYCILLDSVISEIVNNDKNW